MNILIEQNTKYGLVVSSRVIAKKLGKRHKDVLESLKKVLNSESGDFRSLIIASNYRISGQKRSYKEYLLTKDGFTLYMFNIQGYQEFKVAYIRKFNEMEKALKENKLSLTLKNESIEKEIKTFKGQPVMEAVYLQKLTDIPMSTLHKHTKELNCVIRSSDSREYKRENKISRNIPWITILNKVQVIKICKYFGIYETFKNKIEKTYDDELKPLYNHMIELAKTKRDLGLSTFECMKYGGITKKEKRKY